MIDKWGKTHCIMCELPFAQDEQYDEYERLEREHVQAGGKGESDAMKEYGDRYCWDGAAGECSTVTDVDKRIIMLLMERDTLRARIAELEQQA